MNPGLTEEGAKAAVGIIDALKTQPATLAMIVVSFGLLGYTFYEGHTFNAQRGEMFGKFLEQQKEMQVLLSKCVVPGQTFRRPTLLPKPAIERIPEPKPETKP